MTCLPFGNYIPDIIESFVNILGFKEVCTPDWLGTVVQWSKLDQVSFEELLVLFKYLFEKGLIYIQ